MRVACRVVVALAIGCGPHDAVETDAPDTDADAETDSDADADTDTDSDADTDSDTDAPFVVSCDTAVEETGPCTVDADGDGTYLTIQEAVDAASEGDVITVCPGVYDSVVIDTVGVTLLGYGADSTCIIGRSTAGLTLDGVEIDISGFTVSGDATDPAAIDARAATGSLHDLRVAGVEPGTLDITYAALVVQSYLIWEGVDFQHNLVDWSLLLSEGTHTFRHSRFTDNIGALGAFGASGSIDLTNSIFTGNSWGVYTGDWTGRVANNVFYDNGTAVQVTASSSGTVQVRNNVALSNSCGFCVVGPADIDYNVAWDNTWANYSPLSAVGAHDEVIDPYFEDARGGNFRLQPTSTLIDAGDPDAAYDDVDGSRNDIGSFGGPHGVW